MKGYKQGWTAKLAVIFLTMFFCSVCNVSSSQATFCLYDCIVDITFKSTPDSATVRDERMGVLGTTPFSKRFPKGTNLDLTYSLSGYGEEKKSYYDISAPQVVMLELTKKPTYVYVKTTPPGALFEFQSTDGNKIIFTPSSRIQGRQDSTNLMYEIDNNVTKLVIVMSKKGYKTRRETVAIDPNKENHFLFPLERLSSEFSIVSSPSGADVYEKTLGFLGQTPLTREISWDEMRRLSIGKDIDAASTITLHFTVSKTDHISQELIERIQISQESLSRSINVKLAADIPLKLLIDSVPSNADVYEKSLGYLGKTPLSRIITPMDISRLTHKENNDVSGTVSAFLLISMEGYQSIEHKKTIFLTGQNDSLHIELKQN
jgi:hypothetical protein